MKKSIYIITIVLVTATACNKKFEELQQNPNISTSVPANLVLNKLLNGMSDGLKGIKPWSDVARYNQFFCRNYQYYGDNQYNWNNGPFEVYQDVLKNIEQMEAEAEKTAGAANTPYHAVGKFLKVYYYYNLTSLMGDVPLSQAALGTVTLQPVYDSQKSIFLQLFKWLDEAKADFERLNAAKDNSLKGDIFYNANYASWVKLVNTFKLRLLVSLSKKESEADLTIKQRFADAMSASIFEGMADNFSYRYIANVNNYPTNPASFGFDALRFNMAETYVKGCTDISDPRVLITCEPAWKLVADSGWAPTDFRAYVASGTGEAQDIMEGKTLNYSNSLINRYRYYRTFTGEDFIIVGYPEMCFNIAEAINRGWVNGDAEDWYKKGIQASMGFYGIKDGVNTGYYLQVGKSLGDWSTANFDFDFNTYYNQAGVKYESGAAGLNKVLKQKYLAFFQNSGWEAYFNHRRTGVPTFSTGVGIGNNGIIPKRWTYPSAENERNTTNVKAALSSQFNGQDNINNEMWMIK